jgi:hypothetical protein
MFVGMLGTWEGAVRHVCAPHGAQTQPTEIARVLGWVRAQEGRETDRMNHVAEACAICLVTEGQLVQFPNRRSAELRLGGPTIEIGRHVQAEPIGSA